MRKLLIALAVVLCVSPPLTAAPAPPAPPKAKAPGGSAQLAPPSRKAGEVRGDMKKILSGRDYRQLRRQAERLRKAEEEKLEKKKKDRGCDEDEGGGAERQPRNPGCGGNGCRGCGGDGCQGCGGGEGCAGGGGGCAGVGAVAHGLLYLAVILAIVFLVGMIFYSISKYRRNKDAGEDVELEGDEAEEEIMPSTPPGELPSSTYLSRAMELANAGDFKGAIRQLLLGGMSWIERHGLIRYRKGLTNRDYLRAVFGRDPQRQGLGGMVTEFERVYFGRREATGERFQRCLEGYRAGFARDDQELHTAPVEGGAPGQG